jgi:hypothetical protein
VDVRLRPPRQGDGDDGHGLLLDGPDYDRWASLLATGAVLFGPASWWPAGRGGDARTALWTRLASRPRCRGVRPAHRPSLFTDAGMALLRDIDSRPDELWCRADHGPHGYLSIAAHAHADALAIEVRVGGVDVLADPGTYCYGAEPAWRAYFCSTIGHNTLEVGGVDQSVAAGPHLWTRQASAELVGAAGLDHGQIAEWRAAHHGYRRLRPSVVHRRSVRLDRHARRLVVEDRLDGGAHHCRLAFHLGPSVRCTLEAGRAVLRWHDGHGWRGATLTLPDELSWRCLRGETDPPLGWYSPAFGARVPTVTLLGSGGAGDGVVLTTVLQLDPGSHR